MTRAEVEVLLKTIYQPEGSQKFISDLDKISASGQKVAGSLRMAKKEAAEVFSGVSASTRARNPHLFGPNAATSGGGSGGDGVPPIIPTSGQPPVPAGGGAAGGGGRGLLQQFGSRLISRALGITAGLLIYRVVDTMSKVVNVIIKGLRDTAEVARKLYANALQSGLGLQFTTRRSLLSSVLGVSEKDVFQFGAAVAYINPRLQSASDILAKTAPSLAAVSYGFRILEADMQALFAIVANDAAPAIRKTTLFISALVQAFEKLHNVISGAFKITLETLIESLPTGLRELAKSLETLVSNIPDPGAAPNPVAAMQQIHASALEHMGLIVGGLGGATDFAAQTATNTKQTAVAVQKIAQKMSGSSFGNPFGDQLLNSMP